MKASSWTSLGLCLALTSSARAESGIYRLQLSVPAEIPSGGVLPIFGDCYDERCASYLSVSDASSGVAIEGSLEMTQGKSSQGFVYFVPTVPFREGVIYAVSFPGGIGSSFSVVAADPSGLDASDVQVMGHLSREQLVTDRRCCSPTDCLDVAVTRTLALSASISAVGSIATQYLFQVSMFPEGAATESVVQEYSPLRDDYAFNRPYLSFDGAADSYCYTVRARALVGGEPIALATRCFDNNFYPLGEQVLSAQKVAEWAATCEPEKLDAGTMPPVRTSPDAGTLPFDQPDAAVDADGELLGRGEEMKLEEDSGCQLANGKSPASWWPFALLALMRALTKRSRAVGPRRGAR